MAEISVLTVSLYDREIGTLTQLGGDRNLFAFNDEYINDADRSTLSLSFKDAYGELISDTRPTQTRTIPFFANLLPEGHLRDYLAAQAHVNTTRDLPLLWVLGQDLPGAVRVTPAEGEPWPQEAASDEQEPVDQDTALRFSLAGVQLKFSAVKDATGGLTIPARGIGGHWVIKLPSGAYDGVPENEYAMMTLARAIGIDVPEVHLHPLDEINGLPEGIGKLAGHALAVKRFDRTDQGPAHIEDFAQVFGVYPEAKYGKASYRNIASVIWIETGADGLAEYIRRLIFNALIGNADMHLKNWSLIYRDKRTPALAPAYDLVSTIAFVADDTMALTFGHSRRWTDLSLAEVTYFAGKARLPEKLVLDITKETVSRFHEVWASERTHLSLTQHGRNVIADHLKRLPLAADVS